MSGECNRQAAPWHLRIMNDILSAHITIDTAGMEISHTHRNPAKNALSFPFAMDVVVSVIVVELRAYVCYTIHRCTWTAWLPFFHSMRSFSDDNQRDEHANATRCFGRSGESEQSRLYPGGLVCHGLRLSPGESQPTYLFRVPCVPS